MTAKQLLVSVLSDTILIGAGFFCVCDRNAVRAFVLRVSVLTFHYIIKMRSMLSSATLESGVNTEYNWILRRTLTDHAPIVATGDASPKLGAQQRNFLCLSLTGS